MDMRMPEADPISVPLARDAASDAEWSARTELAAAFRVAAHLGWNNTIYNHISARVPDAPDRMLMNPQGAGWHEMTASSLIKADFEGNDLSESPLALAPAGRNFHSAILKLRPDLACVIHVHAMAGVVVSAMEEPLLPIDQRSAALQGKVSCHDYEGIAQEADEGPRIVRDLGGNRLLIMRNHGLLTVGRTIGEAFAGMHVLIDACEAQTRLLATGREPRLLPEAVWKRVQEQVSGRREDGKPAGGLEWRMYRRLADRLDPGYRD